MKEVTSFSNKWSFSILGCFNLPEVKVGTKLAFQLLEYWVLGGNLCPPGERFGRCRGECLGHVGCTFETDSKCTD